METPREGQNTLSGKKTDPTCQMINELLQEFIEATSTGVWFWCRYPSSQQ
jgi:hypothetical protein